MNGAALFEPHFNMAILELCQGYLESALDFARKAQQRFPSFKPALDLVNSLLNEINSF